MSLDVLKRLDKDALIVYETQVQRMADPSNEAASFLRIEVSMASHCSAEVDLSPHIDNY